MGVENELKKENQIRTNVVDSLRISQLFLVWLKIGFTSFGGGATTQYLIQENFIYQKKWITAEEYATIIGVCQITPGINILAYTILIGKRLAGWRGIALSLLGLILPSAGITIGISAIYNSISELPRVQAALRTVFAAIFGISLATNWRNARPILVNNYKRGVLPFLSIIGIMIGSGLLYVLVQPPVVVLYLVGGLCGAVTYWHVDQKGQEGK